MCAMTLTSYSDDDDDDSISNIEDLYVTWHPTHSEGWEKEDGEVVNEWDEDITSSYYQDYERMEFTENEMYEYDYYGGKWVKSSYPYEYTLKGNRIYISNWDDGATPNITIKSLSENQLILESHVSEEYDGVAWEYYNKITYKKVD